MIYQHKVKVARNTHVQGNYYQMAVKWGNDFNKPIPGQFVMIRMPENSALLLRRPFSIHCLGVNTQGYCGFELLYKVVGKGTHALSQYVSNQWIDILGPLGNGFKIQDTTKSAILISGGIGVAPMFFLLSELLNNGTECHVINGGRTKEDILRTVVFKIMGVHPHIYTDDGSVGTKGLATDGLEAYLQTQVADQIYACGPVPMLDKVTEIAKKFRIPCQLSLESHMACGMGACLGCAMPSNDFSKPYYHVCVDGPVFDVDLESNAAACIQKLA